MESSQRYNPGGIIPAVETKPESHWDLFALALLALLFLLAVPGLIDKARLALAAPGTTVSSTLSHTAPTKISSTPKIKLNPVSSLGPITSDVPSESLSPVLPGAEVEPTVASASPQPRIRLKEPSPSISESEEDLGVLPSSETTKEPLRSRIRLGESITSTSEETVGSSAFELEKAADVKSSIGIEGEDIERGGAGTDQDREVGDTQDFEAPSTLVRIPRIKLYDPSPEDTRSSENDNSA